MPNRPIKKWKAGSLESAVWENERTLEGQVISFKTVTLRRSWKQDNAWKESTIQLRKNDLQKAILVLQRAQQELLLDEGERHE